MSSIIPEIVGEVQTTDNTTTTVASLVLPANCDGEIVVDIIGEYAISPATSFYYQNSFMVSQEGGVVTIRSSGAVPFILDPTQASPGVTIDTTASTLRVRITGFVGQTWNWVSHIGGIVHSRLPDGTFAAWDPAVAGTVTPYQDAVYTGTNLVVDGDMELTGVANWPSSPISLTSKQAGGNPGQCLRVTDAGVQACGYQLNLPTNVRTRITADLRTDGTATTSIYMDGSPVLPAPVTPAVWTNYAINNWLWTGVTFRFYKFSTTGTYIEVDNATFKRVPIVTATDSIITGGTQITQSGAVGLRPTYLNTAAAAAQGITGAAFQFDGVGQYWNTGIIPSPEITVGGWFYVDSIAAGTGSFMGSFLAAGSLVFELRRTGSQFIVYYGGVASTLTHGTALTVGWHCLLLGRSGTTLKAWLDGVPASNALALDTSSLPLFCMARNNNGATTDLYISGYLGQLIFVKRMITDAEALSFYYSTYRT